MAPIKRRRCCVPYCKNIQEFSNKQFFKLGANLEDSSKWFGKVGKAVSPKSHVLYCCEDHFDLPNDAENYIKHKYIPGTKLKLRSNILPTRKLPINVCRLCLNPIYNGESIVDISSQKSECNYKIVGATLPEVDLSMTVDPVSCAKCFDCIERYYNVKNTILRSEITVANYMKAKVKKSPTRMIKNCQMDLFQEYNDVMEMQIKDNGISDMSYQNLHSLQSQSKDGQPFESDGNVLHHIKDPTLVGDQSFLTENVVNEPLQNHRNLDLANIQYPPMTDQNVSNQVEAISSDKIVFGQNNQNIQTI